MSLAAMFPASRPVAALPASNARAVHGLETIAPLSRAAHRLWSQPFRRIPETALDEPACEENPLRSVAALQQNYQASHGRLQK